MLPVDPYRLGWHTHSPKSLEILKALEDDSAFEHE